MAGSKPDLIAIDHDEYHARHIGRTADGRQFFLTTPFEFAARDRPGSEYVALFLFDRSGDFIEAFIDDFGQRDTLDDAKRKACYDQHLRDLGDISYQRIEVRPFSIEKFGTTFGLLLREPVDEDDVWAVELMPGNFMAFFEPWDSGEYDT